MLRAAPASLQRLIARTQRISLPRGCTADIRIARLRSALCHTATVRATYANLEPAAQAALQELRSMRGGIAPAALAVRSGAVRSWRAIADDPRPQTLSERLILLGWLLPRPATPRHPARLLLPPELRRWLPLPLAFVERRPAPVAPPTPALRAAHTILIAAAEHPLHVHTRGLRADEQRRLAERLAPFPTREAADLLDCTLAILRDLGLVASHAGTVQIAPAAHRFLALPMHEQRERVQRAWLDGVRRDAWATTMAEYRNSRMRPDGIDWPLLRRRLVAWVESLPVGQLLPSADLYEQLARTHGPLANAQTHGFRTIDRVPWQPRRAAAVFARALRGPLAWLGWVAWSSADTIFRVDRTRQPDPAPPWQYGDPGLLLVAHTASASLLALQPFARWVAADAEHITFMIDPQTLAHAHSRGHALSTLRALLTEQAGPPPDSWSMLLDVPGPAVRISTSAVLLTEQPAVLARATRARSVRRYLQQHIAPGIAVTDPAQVPGLARALARQGIALVGVDDAIQTPLAAPFDLHPGDCAALLVACECYRQHAPDDAPLQISEHLEARLRSVLPPALRAATNQILAQPLAADARTIVYAQAAIIATLQRAQRNQQLVTIRYTTGGRGMRTTRTIRPLELNLCDETWYLRAFCTMRQAERTFRIDRIADCRIERLPDCQIERLGDTPSSNHIIGRIDAHAPDPNDLGTLAGTLIEPITAHPIGVAVDDRPQLGLDLCELPRIQVAFEDTVLHMGTIALEQFEHLGAALVADDIVANDRKHRIFLSD